MHKILKEIPNRIITVATGALAQANFHAVYYDPGMDHWDHISILNAALAGELFLKAIISKEHPLLIFRDLFRIHNPEKDEIDLDLILNNGKTYNFEHLPKLLWIVSGERLPDIESFERLRKVRNSIQHFCAPEGVNFRKLSLEFIYKNIDPLIYKHFGMYAIEFHEDISAGYDYIVENLINYELYFSIPRNFNVSEINFEEALSKVSESYRIELTKRLSVAKREH